MGRAARARAAKPPGKGCALGEDAVGLSRRPPGASLLSSISGVLIPSGKLPGGGVCRQGLVLSQEA